MRIAYQYKLLPTTEQKARFNNWLSMLRHCYNWMLADRFDWYEQNRCSVNACPLISQLPSLREQPEYYGQKRSLVQLKQDKPWYKDVHADVLQDCAKRVKLAFDRFIKGDSRGHRSRKPRFKGRNRYRTFTYSRIKQDCIQENKIVLPKIGAVKLRLHRSLPSGFVIKTALVTKKVDGFYVTLSLEDKSIPNFVSSIIPNSKNSIGIDLGLEKIISTSTGEIDSPPKYFRVSQDKLARLQQKASDREKGSRARKLLYRKVAKLHQKIARARKQFHFETAKWLLSKEIDVVFVEDLQVKNMSRRCNPKQDENGKYLPNGQSRKTGLNKSFADAAFGQFVDILSYKAQSRMAQSVARRDLAATAACKAGLRVIKVDPRGTSQHCSECLNRVSKELSDRWHCCYHCGLILDRDINSAELIKKVGLGASLTQKRSTRKGREAHALPTE